MIFLCRTFSFIPPAYAVAAYISLPDKCNNPQKVLAVLALSMQRRFPSIDERESLP